MAFGSITNFVSGFEVVFGGGAASAAGTIVETAPEAATAAANAIAFSDFGIGIVSPSLCNLGWIWRV
jgi:hypothetical protein